MRLQEDSCPDYMQKAEDALRMEEERVTNYLHVDTKAKLLQEAEREILEQYEAELLDKEDTGAAALMRDDKVWQLPMPLCISTKLRCRPGFQAHALFPLCRMCFQGRLDWRAWVCCSLPCSQHS